MGKELTPEEMEFCNKYEELGYNQVKAAMAVWPDLLYKSASNKASKVLAKENVKEYIEEHRGQIERNLGISKQRMVAILLSTATDENEMARDRTAAIAQICKMLGYTEDKLKLDVDQKVSGGISINIEVKDGAICNDIDKLGL